MNNEGVEEVIDQAVENRRFRIRGVVITFFAILITTTIVFATASISVCNLVNNAKMLKTEANGSSDKYQDIRVTFVSGNITKEYLSDDDIKKEDEKVAEIKAKEKAEEEKKKAEEEKKKAEEAMAKGTAYVPPAGAKIIYLTFDDGPGPYTSRLLDILKKYNVKATFFVTCNRAQYRSMITRAFLEGHAIGLHSCTHNYAKIYQNEQAFFNELEEIENVVRNATGFGSKLVRFPGGSSNTVSKKYNKGVMTRLAKQLTEKGYSYFDWNVSSGDAGETTDTNRVYNNVINRLKGNYSIVLQHDIKEYSVNAVERIIQFGQKNGFTFKKLDESSPTAHHRLNN